MKTSLEALTADYSKLPADYDKIIVSKGYDFMLLLDVRMDYSSIRKSLNSGVKLRSAV